MIRTRLSNDKIVTIEKIVRQTRLSDGQDCDLDDDFDCDHGENFEMTYTIVRVMKKIV